MTYTAPVKDMRFVMEEIAGLGEIATFPGFEEASPDLVDAILAEAGKLTGEAIAPLNAIGDRTGASLRNGVARTPDGFRQAYRKWVDGGWNALPFDPNYGGQGLPWLLAMSIQEMLNAANMAFALCPLLNQGAVELLSAHGSPEQKRIYLPRMISGEWTGTMNLTEPQAGSDIGAVKTRAVAENGHYRLTGQKIFITYGEHDYTDNIVHMVLARTPDAPKGVKGVSLFIVPKFLVNPDGSPGVRNDLRCVSLENKLGIHASPTAVLSYGDDGGATGYLVGEENRGVEYMFTMMNNARLSVGVQGVAIAERAYQQALRYARDRVQGRDIAGRGGGGTAAIARHPDVRRNLMWMKSNIEGMRALMYLAGGAVDRSRHHPDPDERARARKRVDVLTPICKAHCTDMGVELASIGVQIHGGMGFVEETGAAQHYRDARINPIYEGTNGIQALDLVGRKLSRDGGEGMSLVMADMRAVHAGLETSDPDMSAVAARLEHALADMRAATDWMLKAMGDDLERGAAGATPYLRLCGVTICGVLLAKLAQAAAERDSGFAAAKRGSARFYADQMLPTTGGLRTQATEGSAAVPVGDADPF